MQKETEKEDYTWFFEDGAVCRVKRGNSVTDTVRGCVKFIFHIDNSGTRTISVEANGTIQSGKSSYLVFAERPGKLWHEALTRWAFDFGG